MALKETAADKLAHVAGSRKGESYAAPKTHRPTRKANDASGINPDQRGPIHPKMPHMPPA